MNEYRVCFINDVIASRLSVVECCMLGEYSADESGGLTDCIRDRRTE